MAFYLWNNRHQLLASCQSQQQHALIYEEDQPDDKDMELCISSNLDQYSSTSIWNQFLQWMKKWWLLLSRCMHLFFTYSPALLTSPLLLSGSDEWIEYWWTLLISCVKSGGPCGIKLAQWLATRPDLFPVELCHRFQDLQSYPGRLSWSEVNKVLEDNYGKDWEKMLMVERDEAGAPVMLGEGCVAQVLRGYLPDDDEDNNHHYPIAIKLVRPEARESICTDLTLLLGLTRSLESWLPDLRSVSLSDSLEEFQTVMIQQLDMRKEAESLDRFRSNFGNASNFRSSFQNNKRETEGRVSFPEPVPWLQRRDVLVETLETGSLLRDYMETCSEDEKKQLARIGLEAIFQMVFLDSFIHAGN
jgi:aarF domain-containing kinase